MTHPALEAVAQLIRTQVMTVDYDGIPGLGGKLRAPCLLTQLATLIAVGMEGSTHGVPGSRPPVNAEPLDLWIEIVTATATWCQHFDLDRAALRTPAPQEDDLHTTPAVGKLLRSCAAHAISRGQDEVADRIRHNALAWVRRIEAMLGGRSASRGIRGAPCPQCRATNVTEDRDGVGYRMPAVTLVDYEQGGEVLRWLVCSACGWFVQVTGEAMEEPWVWWHRIRSICDKDRDDTGELDTTAGQAA